MTVIELNDFTVNQNNLASFVDDLSLLRKKKNISIKELSELTTIQEKMLADLERGNIFDKKIELSNLKLYYLSIAKNLGLDEKDILYKIDQIFKSKPSKKVEKNTNYKKRLLIKPLNLIFIAFISYLVIVIYLGLKAPNIVYTYKEDSRLITGEVSKNSILRLNNLDILVDNGKFSFTVEKNSTVYLEATNPVSKLKTTKKITTY